MPDQQHKSAVDLARRSGDRHWLRATTRTLILADAGDLALTAWDAAQTAVLLLARVNADIVDADETRAVALAVERVLGDRLGKLRDLWRAAHATGDDDGALELGRRWCEVLGNRHQAGRARSRPSPGPPLSHCRSDPRRPR